MGRIKKIRLDHPYVAFIRNYVQHFHNGEKYIFPTALGGGRRSKKLPYMSTVHAWTTLKRINPKVWCHFFRESLATYMAEQGMSAEELTFWFDWAKADEAMKYIRRAGGRFVQKVAGRSF